MSIFFIVYFVCVLCTEKGGEGIEGPHCHIKSDFNVCVVCQGGRKRGGREDLRVGAWSSTENDNIDKSKLIYYTHKGFILIRTYQPAREVRETEKEK